MADITAIFVFPTSDRRFGLSILKLDDFPDVVPSLIETNDNIEYFTDRLSAMMNAYGKIVQARMPVIDLTRWSYADMMNESLDDKLMNKVDIVLDGYLKTINKKTP